MRLFLLLSLAGFISASTPSSTFSFEPNRGQTDASVQFLARTPSGVVFLTRDEIILHRHNGDTVRFGFAGADPNASWEASAPLSETISYRLSRDSNRWADQVPRYERLSRQNVYPGIDVVFYQSPGGGIEYDFVLQPHADPSRIRIKLDKAHDFSIDHEGNLAVRTASGMVQQKRPVLYQEMNGTRHLISGRFRKLDARLAGFEVSRYDRNLSLSIDPVLEFATYLGGSGDDSVIATDGVRSAGMTTSLDFPGGLPAARKGSDIFVSGVSLSQSGLPTTVIFGGSGNEQVTSASFASLFRNIIVVGGYTNSTDLPVINQVDSGYTGPLYQPNYAGGASDGFLLIMVPDNRGALQTFLTYLGTSGDDQINAVFAPSESGVVVAGSTNGSGLAISAAPASRQIGPGGGIDAFVFSAFLDEVSINTSAVVTFGGSGDDRPYAVSADSFASSWTVGGETTSSDFPLPNSTGQLNGPSDAFVVTINSASYSYGTLIGGSATDRATGIAQLQDGTIVVTGVTASNDLALVNPAQPAFGGGDSDAFFARFSLDLSTVLNATYLGGSGSDQATSLSADTYGNVFIGGWTSSPDFPTTNALQPTFGGGPDDGFLVQLNTDFSIAQATFYGGSGSDRVLGTYAPGGSLAWLAGVTTSTDLPLTSPAQASLKGTSDGFLARLSTNLISIAPPAGGKDIRGQTGFAFATAVSGGMPPTFAITSSDPSTIQLAANLLDPGQSSIAVTAYSSTGSFYLDCLSDHGGANLTITSPGFADRTVRAVCYPIQLFFGYTTSIGKTLSANPPVIQLTPWSGTMNLSASLALAIPTGNSYQPVFPGIVRPGADPITAQILNSNPAVATTSVSQIAFLGYVNSGSFMLQPAGLGQTIVSLSSDRALAPTNPSQLTISVVSPVTQDLSSNVIPSGAQTSPLFSFGSVSAPVTIASQDPSSLVISASPTTLGAATLVISPMQPAQNIWLQALAPGKQVPITISTSGFDPYTTTVTTDQPAAAFSFGSDPATVSPAAPITLGIGESFFAGFSISAASLVQPTFFLLNPGAVPPFSMTADDPTIVAVASPSANSVNVAVQGIAAGTAVVTAQPPAGMPLASLSPSSVRVNVIKKPLLLSDLSLGKDLQAVMVVKIPVAVAAGTMMTVTSSDPTLVLLIAPNTFPATVGSASFSAPYANGAFSFYAQGLAASGQAKVTVQARNYGSVTATITLAPSGFAFSTSSYSLALYAAPTSVTTLTSYVLEPTMLLPATAQAVRAGVTVSGSISNSNPTVVSFTPATFGAGTTTMFFTSLAIGSATLSIIQPSGFTTPATQGQLAVTITPPGLGLNTFTTMGKDTQQALTLTMPGNVT